MCIDGESLGCKPMKDAFEKGRPSMPVVQRLEVLESDAESPTEYTFVPRNADERNQTTWISADANSVLDLADHR